MPEVIAARSFNLLFVILDITWLIALVTILLITKRHRAVLFGLFGGIIYQIVDYGIFYLALGTRVVTGGDPFWVLLWMSMSYGFTNFAFIWLCLDRDGHTLEWVLLIVSGWIAVAFLSQNFAGAWPQFTTSRGTGTYHGVMALIMLVGYAILIVKNVRATMPSARVTSAPSTTPPGQIPIARLLAIGIGVQLGWETVLLLAGIRPTGIVPLIVNSLIETNLGLPYIYLIHRAFNRQRTLT